MSSLSDYDSNSSEQYNMSSWKNDFFSRIKNKILLNVPDEFIKDKFNHTGLDGMVSNFETALEAITGIKDSTDMKNEGALYSLLHSRFITEPFGKKRMLRKILDGTYGMCINISCVGIKLIPIGLNSMPFKCMTRLYCYNCNNIFNTNGTAYEAVDGCAFGPSFPFYMIVNFGAYFKKRKLQPIIPKIYGFEVYRNEENEKKQK